MTLNLSDENFEKEISISQKPVLVDFWMSGCAPCSIISPILDKLTNDFHEKITFAKVNLDAAPQTSQKYGIVVAPTIVLFKEGKAIGSFIGARPELWIREWLDNLTKDNGRQ